MTDASHTLPARPARTRDLARVVDVRPAGCLVQLLDDGSIAEARWADGIAAGIKERRLVVRRCHLVVVAGAAGSAPDAPLYEVIWRGPAVATVTSVDGDRVTYDCDSGDASDGGVTRTLRDVRPREQRRPILSGQQIVVAPAMDDPETAVLLDSAVDGIPQDLDRLREAVLARAARAAWMGPSAGDVPAAGGPGQIDPRRIVAEGYDRIAERYARWAAHGVVDDVRRRYEAHLVDRLRPGASVLELGCGGGGPTTQHLAARFALTGIDISARQIEMARANVPGATFVNADITRATLPAGSFDGVVAFYVFLHLPHGELPGLLRRIGTWLRPGGVLVATLAAGADRGTVEPDWLGVPMYFSGEAPQDVRRFLGEAGLRTEVFQEETVVEDGRPTRFRWVVARAPEGAPA